MLDKKRVEAICKYLEYSLSLEKIDRLCFVFGCNNPEEEDPTKHESVMEYFFKQYVNGNGFSEEEKTFIQDWCLNCRVYLNEGYEGEKDCCFYQAAPGDFCV